MKATLRIALVLVAGWLGVTTAARAAYAYPQYQLSRDTTCTSCHFSPDGGKLLNENGEATADSTAWKSANPAFMYGMDLPDWLKLGGDVRAAAGFVDPGTPSAAAYPMQAEVYARAATHGFSLNVVGGLRRPQDGGSPVHALWSREHYLMWQQHPDSGTGLYIRAGRIEPTFGLRLAEHVIYTQRYGGFPLYDEAYGVGASYVTSKFEVHATGFVHDPIASAVEHGDGGALYAETRIGPHAAIGVDAKYSASDDEKKTFAGITGKLYLPGPDLLFLAEGEFIHRELATGSMNKTDQLAAVVMASKPLPSGLLLDIAAGFFNANTSIKGLDRECIDANLHWFMTSHLEWLLTTRVELLDKGSGPNGGYALAQIHYRL